MRDLLERHGPVVAGTLGMLVLATLLGILMPAPPASGSGAVPASTIDAIALPGPGEDDDGDTFADRVDRADGDLILVVELLRWAQSSAGEPYVLLGSDDDQGRTGAGAELEWRHVVDHDPLGRKAGSPGWSRDALRTGAWVTTLPGEGLEQGAAQAAELAAAGNPPGARWPQSLVLNVRDDRDAIRFTLEAWDAAVSPHDRGGRWEFAIGTHDQSVRDVITGRDWGNGTVLTGRLAATGDEAGLEFRARLETEVPLPEREALAQRWAPDLRFDTDERFYPVPGEVLQGFHGFARPEPDLRTWSLEFNNGRDQYRLLLADFDGDRDVDHGDAGIMADVLSTGASRPTVYANVLTTTDRHVVVQYWFLYLYNFVPDEAGRDIETLAHAGDREFLQLEFASLDAARLGAPLAVTYSQHYGGIQATPAALTSSLFHDGHPVAYVAKGTHASYPAPGDDRGLRPAFTGFHDEFDGQGRRWAPGTYQVEVLHNQTWHAGYLWGPMTRHGRDLGTSLRPLLQHDFRYAFTDPLWWQDSIPATAPDELPSLYGGAS